MKAADFNGWSMMGLVSFIDRLWSSGKNTQEIADAAGVEEHLIYNVRHKSAERKK